MSVKEVYEFSLHVFVDVSVAGEGFAAFFMTAERTYEVGVFYFFVKITDESASRQVAAGYLVERALLFCPGGWIENRYHAIDSACREYFFDGNVIFL